MNYKIRLDVLKSGDIDDIIEKTSEGSEFAKEVEGNDEISKEFDEGGPGNSENAPGQNDEGGPGNSENAPGQNDEGGPGNSENAPGQNDEGGPGNSENAPGQNDEGGPGNSENAPGQNDEGGPGNSENAPGQNDEGGPGNSENAPGQTKDKDEKDLPPGFEAAIDSASNTGKDKGQGLGVGNIPPGQLKKLDIGYFGEYTADDTFEFSAEGLIEDSWEDNYDKMFKGSKEKQTKDKKQNEERLIKEKGNIGGGNPNCFDEGITDGDSTNLTGEVGVDYTVLGFEAVGSNCKDSTDKIRIVVDGPSSPPAFVKSTTQPVTFQPDEAGTWIIQASAVGQFGTRTITVLAAPGGNNPPTADAGPDQTVTEFDVVTLEGSGSFDIDEGDTLTYSWVKEPSPGGANLFTGIPSLCNITIVYIIGCEFGDNLHIHVNCN